MNFIELTNEREGKVYINPQYIIYMTYDDIETKKGTFIRLDNDCTFIVKESIQEIRNMLLPTFNSWNIDQGGLQLFSKQNSIKDGVSNTYGGAEVTNA